MNKECDTIRVLCIHSTDRVGGPGRNILEFLKREPSLGVRTTVATFARRGDPHYDFIDAVRKRSHPIVVLQEAFRYDPRPLTQVSRLFRRERPHVIQSHGHKGNLICLLLRRLWGFRFKWISFFHGRTYEDIKVRLYSALDSMVIARADHIVTVATPIAHEFQRSGIPRSKISVIPNAVDPAIYTGRGDACELRRSMGLCEEDKLVGVIGRLSPEKGQRDFLSAMKTVASEWPKVKAILVGEGPLETELRDTLQHNGLEDHVKLLGHRTDIPELLSALDLLVLPSWSEAMPNVILEAMAAGVPIVSTKVGEVPYMVEHGRSALLVPPRDPEALARAIGEMVSNPDLGPRLVRCASQDVARYHPDRRARLIADLYRKLLRSM